MRKDRTQVIRTTPDSVQADEALRRVHAQQRLAYEMVAERAGRRFLAGLQALPEFKPCPGVGLGALRVTVTVINGIDLGHVDMDPVNLADLGDIAARRAEGLRLKHAALARPTLRVIGGGK